MESAENNKKMFQRLTEEVLSLRKEIRASRSNENTRSTVTILPHRPFDEMDAFSNFDITIKESLMRFDELVIFCLLHT